MSHVTRNEIPGNLNRMLRKAYGALRRGGRVAIHDWVIVADDSAAALASAMFAVNLTVYT